MSQQKSLPIGIQTFSEIIEKNYYYVDKTQYIQTLINSPGKFKFLSRPRRFGKSLLLSTIESLFLGKQNLFQGLAIHDSWDWSQKREVLYLDLSGSNVTSREEIRELFSSILISIAKELGISLTLPNNYRLSLEEIIVHKHKIRDKKVVVLVDEYDDPIASNREKPELARELRDEMRAFYKNFKRLDKYIHFGFLTGVTKFAHLNLFSGLNNIRDISLESDFNAICGYTEKDVLHTFKNEFRSLQLDKLRKWYNGYSWNGIEKVYNPHDLLYAFLKQKYSPEWLSSGTTQSLHDIIQAQPHLLHNLIERFQDATMLGDIIIPIDIEQPDFSALLFQTGYLTVDSVEHSLEGNSLYHLRIPNQEVEIAFAALGISSLSTFNTDYYDKLGHTLRNALQKDDFGTFFKEIKSLYSAIPHDAYRKNNMFTYEGFYATTFLFLMRLIAGKYVYPEDSCSTGRTDITLLYNESYYIFEFKVVDHKAKKQALQQIIEKDYPAKYRAEGKPIYLIGIEFSKKTRTIAWYDVQKDKS